MSEACLARMEWRGDRKESPGECARRTIGLIEELAQIDPALTRFEKTSRKRGKYVRSPIPLQVDELASLFAKGVSRQDSDRSAIEELGYGLWVLTPGNSNAWLRIRCGVYDSPANVNSCDLVLSFRGAEDERIVNVASLSRIMRALAAWFEPQVGRAGYNSYRDAVVQEGLRKQKELRVDWIMYFSREWGTVPPLPAPVRIEPVGDQGALIILTPERISASNPEHVELGRRVRILLNRAHLLDDRLVG